MKKMTAQQSKQVQGGILPLALFLFDVAILAWDIRAASRL